MFAKLIKIKLFENTGKNKNKGMTYVELIVVLGIFAIMSSITIFNYQDFQKRVDLKNMANDIALQIVKAQKDAMAGKQQDDYDSNWKPAYGVRFVQVDQNSFKYFTETSGLDFCSDNGGDCANFVYYPDININKGDKITSLGLDGSSCAIDASLNDLNIIFRRPDSSAKISSSSFGQVLFSGDCHAVITISTPDNDISAKIKVYPSGKVEIE